MPLSQLSSRRLWLIASALFAVMSAVLVAAASHIVFVRSPVLNISERGVFSNSSDRLFRRQRADSPRVVAFRDLLPSAAVSIADPYERALAIRHWVRAQQPSGQSWLPIDSTLAERIRGDSEDPFELLARQRSGAPANCRRFSILFVSAATSAHLQARMVIASEDFRKPNRYSYVIAEVWIPERNAWILMDPMWDLTYTVKGQPASALQVFDAARFGQVDTIARQDAVGTIHTENRLSLASQFRHVFYSDSNAYFDGDRVCFACSQRIGFLHLSAANIPVYPEDWKLALVYGSPVCLLISIVSAVLSILAKPLASRKLLQQRARPTLLANNKHLQLTS